MQLTAPDWTIIVLYFVIALGIGLAFRKRAGKNLTEYFISGRSLPWWLAGTSMVATTFAADTPLAVTGLVAKHGLAGNWFWWSFALGGMVTVFVYARFWRRTAVLTDVELVEIRYGGKPAAFLRGFRAIYISVLVNAIIMGWVTGAMVTVLKNTVFSGVEETANQDWLMIAVLLAIVGIYATLSGLWGVVVTDFVQFLMAMTGSIILAFVAVKHLGGIDAMREQVSSQFGSDQAFRFLPDFSGADPWMPLGLFLTYLFVQWWASWYPGAEPGGGGYIVQRMASAKDEKHSMLATLWFQIAHYCVRPWPWIIVAFSALAMYPGLGASDNPGAGFPMVIRDLAPAGVRGLLLVAFFAAFMSTISTQLNWGASYLVSDFYKRFIRPDADDRHLTTASRIASVGMLILGGFAAWFMKDTSVDDAWKFLAALGAGTGAVFMARWFWWRINAWSEIVAMVASLLSYLLVRNFIDQEEYRLAVVGVITMASWLAATWLTRPEDEAVLRRFFSVVRPGGPGWKPIAEAMPEVKRDKDLGISIAAALLASGIVYLTLPGVGLVIFGSYGKATLCLLGAAACGVGVKVLMDRLTWEETPGQ